MRPRQRYLFSGVVRALCVISLILVAFAHHPEFALDSNAAAATVVFPDGSVAVICLSGQEDDGKHSVADHCEFCRIAGSVALPELSGEFEPCDVVARSWILFPNDATTVRQTASVNPPTRGPPLHT